MVSLIVAKKKERGRRQSKYVFSKEGGGDFLVKVDTLGGYCTFVRYLKISLRYSLRRQEFKDD